jgi:hypothetical protein
MTPTRLRLEPREARLVADQVSLGRWLRHNIHPDHRTAPSLQAPLSVLLPSATTNHPTTRLEHALQFGTRLEVQRRQTGARVQPGGICTSGLTSPFIARMASRKDLS